MPTERRNLKRRAEDTEIELMKKDIEILTGKVDKLTEITIPKLSDAVADLKLNLSQWSGGIVVAMVFIQILSRVFIKT